MLPMRLRSALRGLAFFVAVALFGSVAQLPAFSVTKSQVDAACASSSAQYNVYQEKQRAFEEATLAWEQTLAEIAALEDQRAYVDESINRRMVQIESSTAQIDQLAVQLYMDAGGSSSVLLFAGTVDEVLTGNELLDAATGDSMAALDDLLAVRNDLDRFQLELTDLDAQLREVEAERASFRETQAQIAEEADAAFRKLSAECQNLTNQYEREQAAARAAAAARRGGGSGGVGTISGFRCPLPGSSFIDSWGFPRSGGRSHKGTDMFQSWNASVIAVADGVVSIRFGRQDDLVVGRQRLRLLLRASQRLQRLERSSRLCRAVDRIQRRHRQRLRRTAARPLRDPSGRTWCRSCESIPDCRRRLPVVWSSCHIADAWIGSSTPSTSKESKT